MVLPSWASFRNPAKPRAAVQGNCGQSLLCWQGQKGHLVSQNFCKKLVKPHWQRAAPLSVTGHCSGRNSSFTSKALAAGRSPWKAAGLSGPNHAVPILSPLEQTGTTLPPSAHQAHENSTQASTASQRQQSKNKPGPPNPEKMYFSNTQNTSAKLSIILLLLLAFLFKRHLPCLFTIPLHSATAQVSHMLPAPSPHRHNSIPAGWSKPAHKQAPFIMQVSKPSQGQLNFPITSPAQLCCGQEPEPHLAPRADRRAAPRSAHLF